MTFVVLNFTTPLFKLNLMEEEAIITIEDIDFLKSTFPSCELLEKE